MGRRRSPPSAATHVVPLFDRKLRILMTRAQRRHPEDEARRRGSSVAAVIREALALRAIWGPWP